MELMSLSLDKFYKFVHGSLQETIPEDILGKITVAVRKMSPILFISVISRSDIGLPLYDIIYFEALTSRPTGYVNVMWCYSRF